MRRLTSGAAMAGRHRLLVLLAVVAAAGGAAWYASAQTGGRSAPKPPPTSGPPLHLRVVASTPRSVTLAWRRPSRARGKLTYRVLRDGVLAVRSIRPVATIPGLACAQSYTFTVEAVPAGGPTLARASIQASTAGCPLEVAANGSDANRCTAAAPCQSFNRAYHVAKPGDIVEVAGGVYPGQLLTYDTSKQGATLQHVVFQPAPGAHVTIDGDLELSNTRTVKGASHVSFRDFTLTGNVDLEGCGVPDGTPCPPDATAGSNDLTFQNLRVRGSVAFLCHSCSNVQILGGVWGPDTYLPCSNADHPEVSPTYDTVTFVKLKRPNHILIDGARFQNFARCSAGDHTECLQFEPADYVTIRDSVFTHCDTITLAFFASLAGDSKSPSGYPVPDHIVIENNFIDQSYDATGGPTYNGLQFDGCTHCLIAYNSWVQNAHMPANGSNGIVSIDNRVIGNVGPQTDCGNGGITFSHNVFEGVKCGPTDKKVSSLGFVDPRAMNLHLTATSPAIGAGDPRMYPRRDIDGNKRPIGKRVDAGADERVGGR